MATLTRSWLTLFIRGILAIIFGILALFYPSITLAILIALFGIYVFANGILTFILSFYNRKYDTGWWVYLLEGLVSIIFGIMVFSWPLLSTIVLLYIIAAWAIITGVMQLIAYIKLQEIFANELLLAISGVLSIVIGILLFRFPIGGIVMVAWIIGLYALIFGILSVISSLHIRKFSID